MKEAVIDTTNKKVTELNLPDEMFAAVVNPVVLAQYIRVYRNNQRQNSNKVLSRGEVTGTTAKVWRQKGTGRARHGSRKAPIFVGGGKAHGPDGNQNYKRVLPKKVRRLAILGALTTQVNNSTIMTGLEKINPKTKDVKQVLEATLDWKGDQKVIFILESAANPVVRGSKGLANVKTTQAKRINAYELLTSDHLIFSQDSIDALKETFLKDQAKQVIKSDTKKKQASK